MRAVNLIPQDQRTGASVGAGRSQGGAYAVLVLAGGLALLGFLYGRADHQAASRRSEAASITAQAQQAQTAAEKLAPYTSFIALREQRTQTVNTLIDSRFDWAHVFHEFGRVLPVRTSISSLTGTITTSTTAAAPTNPSSSSAATPSAPASSASSSSASSSSASHNTTVASATPPGSVPTFIIAGCATSQPVVAQTLQRLRLIDGVSAVTLESSTATGSSGGGGGGGCPPGGPVFTVQITFDPLPSVPVHSSSTQSVSDSSAASAPTTTTTSGAPR
jgi:hypothetical protein